MKYLLISFLFLAGCVKPKNFQGFEVESFKAYKCAADSLYGDSKHLCAYDLKVDDATVTFVDTCGKFYVHQPLYFRNTYRGTCTNETETFKTFLKENYSYLSDEEQMEAIEGWALSKAMSGRFNFPSPPSKGKTEIK